jgi:hypothetical protein
MKDTSGFYKQELSGQWLYGPNFVYHKDYTLLREDKDSYTYPIDGWKWYNEQPFEDEILG